MDILYFFSNPALREGNELLATRRYDAVYSDTTQKRTGLAACLRALKKGDVLHIARETHLGDAMADVVEILAALARKGVDVRLGRTGTTLHAESSPYLPLTANVVAAFRAFVNAMRRHRAVQGIKRARAEGKPFGKPRLPLLENFTEMVRDWRQGNSPHAMRPFVAGCPKPASSAGLAWRCNDGRRALPPDNRGAGGHGPAD